MIVIHEMIIGTALRFDLHRRRIIRLAGEIAVIHPIALNQPKVLPISTQLTGEYGVKATCTSIPTLVGKGGVLRRFEVELWPREASGIVTGARQLDETYAKVT